MASRIMEIMITMPRGITAVFALSGETAGIDCKVATTRKYAFESFRNWASRHIGKNDKREYLVVLI